MRSCLLATRAAEHPVMSGRTNAVGVDAAIDSQSTRLPVTAYLAPEAKTFPLALESLGE